MKNEKFDFELISVLFDVDTSNCTEEQRGAILLYRVASVCRDRVLRGQGIPDSLWDLCFDCVTMMAGKDE